MSTKEELIAHQHELQITQPHLMLQDIENLDIETLTPLTP